MNKKDQILIETFALFSEKGYNLSISDIAKKVAIKPPSIYSHFQSKDEIIEKVVNNEIENFFCTLINDLNLLDNNNQNSPSYTYKAQIEHVFWSVFEYFHERQRLRFWRNIPLIENDEIKESCKQLIRKNEVKYNKLIVDLFNRAAINNEIKESYHEGHIFLFIAMIQGLLNVLLMCNNLTDMYECAKKTWDAYWDSIKG